MAGLLRRFLSRPQGASAGPETAMPTAARILTLKRFPDAIYAVGDVHGCCTLYRQMEQQIIADAAQAGISGPKLIVLLGDVVDRGPDSAGMLHHLTSPPPEGFQRLVLRGNHEDMMLAFLSNPAASLRWLDFGGDQTLMSYGLHPEPEQGFAMRPSRLAHMLDTAIPQSHRDWLSALPMGLQVGDLVFAHAGLDPRQSLQEQDPAHLLWGDPEAFDTLAQGTELRLVHGHVIVPSVQLLERRINLDTGAYASGILSAVRLQQDAAPYILSVSGNSV